MLIPFRDLKLRHGITIDRVIHAGAHFGEEAAAYAEVGASRVLWIEGNPDILDQLRATVAPYGHRVVHSLLGAVAGREVDFNISNFDSMSSSVLEFGTHRDAHAEVLFVGQQRHRLRTLDDVALAAGFIGADFLNLDLQGYELECLKGATRVLEAVQTVYTEINIDELYSGCVLLPELDSWLNQRGFEVLQIELYGSESRESPEFAGWGDACYVRVPTPRSVAQQYPAQFREWSDLSSRRVQRSH